MIEVKNLCKTYGSGDTSVAALVDVSYTFYDNTFYGIIGESGSGKSTLMNLIGALDRPSSGSVVFDGADISTFSDDRLSDYRCDNIGYIFQNFYLDNNSSVMDNVVMPLVIKGVGKKEREEEARRYLALLGILDKEKTLVKNLSGGQKQRVCIARAIINNPSVVLADEPTGNLDSRNSDEVLRILKEIKELGKTVILISHDVEACRNVCDKLLVIKDGILNEA